MEGSVMGSKRLIPTRVGKMTSKCLLLLFAVKTVLIKSIDGLYVTDPNGITLMGILK